MLPANRIEPTETMPLGSKPPDLPKFCMGEVIYTAIFRCRAGGQAFGRVDDGVGVDAVMAVEVIDLQFLFGTNLGARRGCATLKPKSLRDRAPPLGGFEAPNTSSRGAASGVK